MPRSLVPPALLLLLALPRAAQEPASPAPERPPNFVVVLTDDQGWADVGCYSGEVETPNMDRLIEGGARFTQAYVSAPTCSASRAGILTGRYQQRFGFYGNYDSKIGLPAEERTLAEALREAGYATGIVGKWHLGKRAGNHPLKHGFDEFYGFTGMGHTYVDLSLDASPSNPIWRDDRPVDDAGYLTDRLTDEAVAFFERHRDEPFFLYLPYNAPHLPLEPPPDWPPLESESPEELERHAFLGLLDRLDRGVGRLLDALEELGLEEDTLVVFLSDNGGSTEKNRSSNGPLRGLKHDLWEGGIRVPFALRWPGRIPAGTVLDEPVLSLDVYATCLAAAGLEPPTARPPDGVDLLPLATGAVAPGGEPLHPLMHWVDDAENWAVRRGPWKLVKMQLDYQLFHVATDPGETDDRYPVERDLVNELLREHAAFARQLPPRLWTHPRDRAGSDGEDEDGG